MHCQLNEEYDMNPNQMGCATNHSGSVSGQQIKLQVSSVFILLHLTMSSHVIIHTPFLFQNLFFKNLKFRIYYFYLNLNLFVFYFNLNF